MQRPPLSGGLLIAFPLVVSCCLLQPGTAHGLGLRIPNQDAEAIARGNAFTATADNPSAIYYNPAGITQLEGHNIQFGMHVLAVNSEYADGAGLRLETRNVTHPIPQLYYTFKPKDWKVAFGLGAYAPYGLGLEWPETTGFRTLAIEGRLDYFTINPVVAWQVHPTLSLAVGPTFNQSKVYLRRGIGLIPGDEFRFRGDDIDFGFKAGLRWQPHEKWAFGISYHSPTTMDYQGTSRTTPSPPYPAKANTSGELEFAQFAMAGVSFRPNKNWNIEVNVDWSDWETTDQLVLKNTGFGNQPFPLNWRTSFLYEVGVSRYFENGMRISAGYFYSARSTTERDFNPILPDTDLHVGSVGFGWKGERWSWAVAAQIITGPGRPVDSSTPNPVSGENANGTYRWFNQSVNFSVGYRF